MSETRIAEPAIAVHNLTMSYNDFVVQRGLDFGIESGEIFVIMGDSGSGKSTLLRHMIGLKAPAGGDIRYWGKSFWDADETERLKITHRFGVLYQSGALWSSMTLAENVCLPIEQLTDYSQRDIAELVALKLSLVGLSGFEDFYPSELSGGMRKRAGLARAMALDPEILFFDEPSGGLDPINAKRLDNLIIELRESLGTTIVIVTHELASICTIADNAVFLDADTRTQTALGNPRALKAHPPNQKVGQFLSRSANTTGH